MSAAGETRECAHCGAPFTLRPRGLQAMYCHAEPGKTRSLCASRAREAARRETNNAYCRERYKARMADPEKRACRNARQREQNARRMQNEANREKRREIDRRKWQALKADPVRYRRRVAALTRTRRKGAISRPEKLLKVTRRPLAGSVLASASLRSQGRDILDALLALVPRGYDPDTRSEIISAAALLVIEGANYPEAVETARRQVLRDQGFLRRAMPIEACFWL